MPPKSGKKKDEKPPPATGPGSKIKALPEPLRKGHIKRLGETATARVHLQFGTANMKSLPVEIYNNEELSALTIKFNAENNRLKRLPKSISALENLESIEIQNNNLSAFPASVAKLKKLQFLNISSNNIKKLPNPIHKATSLTRLLAPKNRIRTLPKNIGKSPSLEYVDVSHNMIKSFKKGVYEAGAFINFSHNRITEMPPATGKLVSHSVFVFVSLSLPICLLDYLSLCFTVSLFHCPTVTLSRCLTALPLPNLITIPLSL